MNKVYIVTMSTGEYSDCHETLIKAFSSRACAEKYLEDIDNVYKKFQHENCGHMRDEDELDQLIAAMTNMFNFNFQEDYTGTYFYITEVYYFNE